MKAGWQTLVGVGRVEVVSADAMQGVVGGVLRVCPVIGALACAALLGSLKVRIGSDMAIVGWEFLIAPLGCLVMPSELILLPVSAVVYAAIILQSMATLARRAKVRVVSSSVGA